MKCVILDDEPIAIGILEDYVDRVPFLERVGSFRNPLEALAFLQSHDVDLILLDINMPGLTGLQLLRSLAHPPWVILTTAYQEYALAGYEHDVVDYLLKPIEFERFLRAVGKTYELAQARAAAAGSAPATVLVKSGTKLHQLRLAEVRSVNAAGNYVAFCTGEREVLALMTMKEALAALPASEFVRVHRSHVVNLRHVEIVENDAVVVDKRRIPVAETYRAELVRRLAAQAERPSHNSPTFRTLK